MLNFLKNIFSGKSKKQTVSSTYSFSDPLDVIRFNNIVEEYFKSKNIQYTLEIGFVRTSDGRELGLDRLASEIKEIPFEEWKGIIFSHFDSIINYTFDEKILENYNDVKSKLFVSLYNIELMGTDMTKFLSKEVIPGILGMIMLDGNDKLIGIDKKYLEKWQMSLDEVFNNALLNNKQLKYNKEELPASKEKNGLITVLSEPNGIASTGILFPNDFPELIGAFGSIIAVPSRDDLIFYPVNDLSLIGVLNVFPIMVNKLFNESPRPVSEKFYWWNKTELIDLPYNFNGKELKFAPPESFLSVMNSLPKTDE